MTADQHRPTTKILAIKTRALGDTVIATAALQSLRHLFPNTQLDVLVRAEWAPLLEGAPYLNRVLPFERSRSAIAGAAQIARLGAELRSQRYDMVAVFHASTSSTWLAVLSGAKVRAIHHHDLKSPSRFSTLAVPDHGQVKPVTERDFDLIRAIAAAYPEAAARLRKSDTQLTCTAQERERASSRLSTIFGKSPQPRPLVVLGPAASRPTKRWPIESYVDLATRLTQRGCNILATFARGEESLSTQFEQEIRKLPTTAAGCIRAWVSHDLRGFAAILSHARLWVGNDSGPKHMAVALGVPTITVFGPEDPFEWHPYDREKHRIHFIPALKCRNDALPGNPPWCGLHTCVAEKHRCMRDISVDEVLESCQKQGL